MSRKAANIMVNAHPIGEYCRICKINNGYKLIGCETKDQGIYACNYLPNLHMQWVNTTGSGCS